MALIPVDLSPTSVDDFIAMGLPKDYTVDVPLLGVGTPKVAPNLGTQAFDAGLDIKFVCPGWPTCKRATACEFNKKVGVSLDPSKLIPGIPALPALNLIIFPGYRATVKVPPDIYNPLKCPNYPNKV
jgi:hypothetical protein